MFSLLNSLKNENGTFRLDSFVFSLFSFSFFFIRIFFICFLSFFGKYLKRNNKENGKRKTELELGLFILSLYENGRNNFCIFVSFRFNFISIKLNSNTQKNELSKINPKMDTDKNLVSFSFFYFRFYSFWNHSFLFIVKTLFFIFIWMNFFFWKNFKIKKVFKI